MADVLDTSVLVLNKHYQPVNIVTARRAFVMLWNKVVEVISYEDTSYCNHDFRSWAEVSELRRRFLDGNDHDWVFTPRLALIIPRIVRLLHYDRIRHYQVKLTRRNVFYRDDNVCQYCGERYRNADLNIDHVVPKSRGGRDAWENLVCACLHCNIRKGSKLPAEAGMRLIRQPKAPSLDPMIRVYVSKRKYASWRNFLDDAYWDIEIGE